MENDMNTSSGHRNQHNLHVDFKKDLCDAVSVRDKIKWEEEKVISQSQAKGLKFGRMVIRSYC